MEYDPSDVVGDFARRTKDNLRVIEALAETHLGKKPEPKVWEFTQLVNSLLGLLVFPQQEWFEKLPETRLADLPERCWQNLRITIWGRKHKKKGPLKGALKDKTFKELAICLRNSITHFNVKVEVDAQREIRRVCLWNVPEEDKPDVRDFEVVLDIVTLRQIAMTFIEHLEKPPEHAL